MRVPRLLLLVPLASLCPVPLQAQNPASTQRDPQAVSTVQAAINAIGGAATIGQIQSWQAQGQIQGLTPDGRNVSGTVTWEMAGPEFRIETSTSAGASYLVTGHGSPAFVQNGTTRKVPAHVISATFITALVAPLLLQAYQNSNYSLRYVGSQVLGSNNVTQVSIAGVEGTSRGPVQNWYFDNASHLPVRIEYRLRAEESPLVSIAATADLSNYRSASGALYPFNIVLSQQGNQLGTITLQSVNVNVSIPASDFDAPVGGTQ